MAEPRHMPTPTDICTTCGNGLVHIDSWRDIEAALDRAEAQDTAASSGLREALDQHRLSSRGAGLWSCRCGYSGLGYIDHLVAALAHSTPEPSLRDALAALIEQVNAMPVLKVSGEALTETLAETSGVVGAEQFFVDWDEQEWFVAQSTVIALLESRAALPGLSLSAQPALRDALEKIRDMEPREVEMPDHPADCIGCADARTRGWPPSRVCSERYSQLVAHDRRRDQEYQAQVYRMRDIANAALSAQPSEPGETVP